ncbi:hypothetical protein AYL99_08932 [Fonsecaea erecta]|uniref:Amino acid permease/ SLC12A domain-containing protein n=1 Tax=Fonsecaea erecta TaxID=1367422 RepID=A0A178ZAL5_9EURO|nr:hypothetical protein AYL99_08932 [Fonsecaea erecta]OAP56820.1 hypothetical protein AYL99_08932 [Fonsecaea erecta]
MGANFEEKDAKVTTAVSADGTVAEADGLPLEAEPGQIVADWGADSGLSRRLSSRHLLMMSMGASIGQGLWLGSGSTINRGGPVGLLLGYMISGSVGWAVNQCIGEMAVLYPVPSAFPQWTRKFVDAAPAFVLGWAYWFAMAITIGNELQGLTTVVKFWTDAVPTAAWLTIFLICILLVCTSAVAIFAEAETVMTIIKFTWVFIVLIVCIVISAGGGPKGDPIGFRYWNSDPFNHNGFHGFLSVFPTCIFALGGIELTGVVAAEAKNPSRSVPKAVSAVWIRLMFFYVLGSIAVGITTDPNNEDLFGGNGTNASPFVIAFRDSGLPALAHVMNVIILISVWSCANACAYGATRTPIGLAHIGMAPKIFLKCDKWGRPWGGIIISFLLGGGLCYMNVSETAATVFGWLSDLASLVTLYCWGLIFLCHIRFRAAWKAQGHSLSELPWTTRTFPYLSYYGLVVCVVLIVVEFYLAVWPLHGPTTAANFFANYMSIIAMVVMYVGAKIYYRGPLWIKAENVDLVTGRRYYVDADPDTDNLKKKPKVSPWMFWKAFIGETKF